MTIPNQNTNVSAGDVILADTINNIIKDTKRQYPIELGEDLSAGDLVRLINDSGSAKLKNIIENGGSTVDIYSYGTKKQLNNDDSSGVRCCKVTESKVLFSYRSFSNSESYLRIGNISNRVLTLEPQIIYASNYKPSINTYLEDNKILCANFDSSMVLRILTISGNTITQHTLLTTSKTSYFNDTSFTKLDTSRVFFCKWNTSTELEAGVITITDTDVSIDTTFSETRGNGVTNANQEITSDLINTDKILLSFGYSNDPTYNFKDAVRIFEISGTTVTAGGISDYASYDFGTVEAWGGKCARVADDIGLLIYDNTTNLVGVKVTISGSTLSLGVENIIQSTTKKEFSVKNLKDNYCYLVHEDGQSYLLNITSSIFDISSATNVMSSGNPLLPDIAILNDTLSIVGFGDANNNEYQTANLCNITSGNTINSSDAIGILQESGSTGEIKTVSLLGGLDESNTGLTIGSIYYISYEGYITTIDDGNGAIGRAISSNQILLTKNP